jgi:predicted  nucleic acid-binding Zn-ribbon protein
VQFLQADEKVLKDKLAKLGRDKDVIIKSLNQFKPELTTAKKAMKEGQTKVAELDEKIHAIVDKIYASFAKVSQHCKHSRV